LGDDDEFLQINPLSVAAEFMRIVNNRYEDYPKQDPKGRDTTFANKLFRKFLHLLDDFEFREDEELFLEGIFHSIPIKFKENLATKLMPELLQMPTRKKEIRNGIMTPMTMKTRKQEVTEFHWKQRNESLSFTGRIQHGDS